MITGFFIGDIYVPKFNVIIEVDGGYHFTVEQARKDAIRTSELRSLGYKVFRCKNEEVMNLEALLVKLIKFLSI
jgi:leucyl-tRNA synthetase/ATP-dependent DNA helicase RecG/methylmalonyl-CoA mutase